MEVRIHPHAKERMVERGTTLNEVKRTVERGERFEAKFERIGFRRNFSTGSKRQHKKYKMKQLEVYGVKEHNTFTVITVIVKYF